MSEREILKIFKDTDALLSGHFLLTSGLHSKEYFQCAKVLQYPDYTKQLCSIISNYFSDVEIDTVMSPAIGGLVVGQEVARQLNKRFIFAERDNKELLLRRGFVLKEGEKVLVCEDVVTTGGSVFETIEIINSNNAVVAGVGIIVDRSNGKIDFGYPQVSVAKLSVKSFQPDECPYCLEEQELIKPGSRKVHAG